MKWIVFLTLVFLTATAHSARAQAAGSDSTQVHVVRPGDTLWDLARQYLRNPFLWPEILSINQGTVVDPHLIYPQERIRIPFGQSPAEAQALAPAQVGVSPTRGEGPRTPSSRTVFFSGEGQPGGVTRSVRVSGPETVPVVPAGAFYSAGVLVAEADMAEVARLVEVVGPTVLDRSSPPQIHPYDKVNMVVAGPGVSIGERLQLVRPGREVRPYGRIYFPTGSGRVLNVEAGVATVEVDQLYDRVEIGDIAMATPAFDVPAGVLPVPAGGLEGQLLAFRSSEPIASTEDVGFVNLGAASGVVVGDEYEAYIPASQEDWGRRPEVVVARLQVVRVTEVTSAVRVVSLEYPALQEGLPVRLVARMP
jgi:hypothetical protein